MGKYQNKLRCGEIALMLALVSTLLWGAWSMQEQDALEQKMIRLHVIANSDTAADQALKLRVRDEVLSCATEILQQSRDMADAERKLDSALPDIEAAAQKKVALEGYDYRVSARLEQTEFPTKEYDGFALPAGEYLALRVVIGEGAGQNWWCVVFPPLCTAAATDLEETAIATGLGEKELSLITEEHQGYVLKFRSLELWETLRQWFKKH